MRILLLLLSFITSGCASLLVHQDDPTSIVAAKTIWRAVLGVSTLGMSEVQMSALRDAANAEALADQRLQDYEWHLTYLVNNGGLTQREAEDLYQKYAALVWQDTLEATGGADPMGLSAYDYPFYGAGFSGNSPWLGLASSSRLTPANGGIGRLPISGSQWAFRNNYARMSALARYRAGTARWSRFIGGTRGYYLRGGGSKGSGRRGGRR